MLGNVSEQLVSVVYRPSISGAGHATPAGANAGAHHTGIESLLSWGSGCMPVLVEYHLKCPGTGRLKRAGPGTRLPATAGAQIDSRWPPPAEVPWHGCVRSKARGARHTGVRCTRPESPRLRRPEPFLHRCDGKVSG